MSRPLEEALTLRGVPYTVVGGQPFWSYAVRVCARARVYVYVCVCVAKVCVCIVMGCGTGLDGVEWRWGRASGCPLCAVLGSAVP